MGWEVGGRFKRERTYIYLWLIHVNVWQNPAQYYKAIILQLKINEFFQKIRISKKSRSKVESGGLKMSGGLSLYF